MRWTAGSFVAVISLVAAAFVAATAATAQEAWSQLGGAIDGTEADEGSGTSVAISEDGTIMAVGSRFYDSDGKDDRGRVRVFSWDGGTWSQLGDDLLGTAEDDSFGASIALSADGRTVAVGAPDGNSGTGQVRVFSFDGTSWTQDGQSIDGGASGDVAGRSVALSSDGTTVAFGAPFNDSDKDNAGQVRVFSFDGTNWAQVGGDIYGTDAGDRAGWSVALSSDGERVAVGADRHDSRKGQTRILDFDGTSWTQVGTDIDGQEDDDNFGVAVSLSADGRTVAVAASPNGGAYTQVWSETGGSWSQVGANIEALPGEVSGQPVSLASDGRRLAIGYPRDDNATDDGPGRVAVYERSGDSWSQLGADIYGEANGDYAGGAVALSGNGLKVAIGAREHDDAVVGSNAGQVRVFRWPTGASASPGAREVTFTFWTPDGRECTSISPVTVRVGSVFELPGVDALCQTMEGASVAGWTIPVSPGSTQFGSPAVPFPPGLKVRVADSQRFTVVPFEPVLTLEFDANVGRESTCVVNEDVPHLAADDRANYVWVPRADAALARFPLRAACIPPGHELIAWNTAGDGSGENFTPGSAMPPAWADGGRNHHVLYAIWGATD